MLSLESSKMAGKQKSNQIALLKQNHHKKLPNKNLTHTKQNPFFSFFSPLSLKFIKNFVFYCREVMGAVPKGLKIW